MPCASSPRQRYRRMRRLTPVAMVLLALVGAGCVVAPFDAVRDQVAHDDPFYLLDVRVTILSPYGEGEEPPSTLGAHCGQAYESEGTWHLERNALRVREEPGAARGPPVVVRPEYEAPPNPTGDGWWWPSMGTEPAIHRMPLQLGPGYRYDAGNDTMVPVRPLVVDLRMEDGQVTSFGAPVTLPVSWTVDDPDGRWTAEVTLRGGPQPHHRWTLENCA